MESKSELKSLPFSPFSLSTLLWCELSSAVGSSALTLPLETRPFSSVLVLVWSVTICDAKAFSGALPLACASLFDSTSNISEIATSLTKSAVVGLMPSAELTPVFSPADWASAGPTSRMHPSAMMVRFMAGPSARGFAVDALAQRHRVEFGIRGFFLVQIGVEETNDVVVPEFFRPGDQCAVTGDLVMLDGLRGSHDRSVEHGLVLDFARGRVGFLDQAVDRRAVGARGLFAELVEHLLEPLDLLIGFLQMALEALRKIAVGRQVNHLRQRLGDLLFGVIHILQPVQQQIVHRLDVFRKQSHVFLHEKSQNPNGLELNFSGRYWFLNPAATAIQDQEEGKARRLPATRAVRNRRQSLRLSPR